MKITDVVKVLHPIKHINWCCSFHLQKLVCLISRDQKECYCEATLPPPAKHYDLSAKLSSLVQIS